MISFDLSRWDILRNSLQSYTLSPQDDSGSGSLPPGSLEVGGASHREELRTNQHQRTAAPLKCTTYCTKTLHVTPIQCKSNATMQVELHPHFLDMVMTNLLQFLIAMLVFQQKTAVHLEYQNIAVH